MSEEAKWYVVHTYSGYENKVKSNIEKVVENRNLQDLIPEDGKTYSVAEFDTLMEQADSEMVAGAKAAIEK